uniref:Uncharacterized protein n=1 Tax=Anopheles melas TaxID=34690 RepID=A0A182TDB5_9DIPT
MLLQLDCAIEATASSERLQRSSSSSSSSRTKDIITAPWDEAINGTVLGKTVPSNATVSRPTEARSYAHVTGSMAHGNSSSGTLASALVPPRAPNGTVATTTTPTEQPARKALLLQHDDAAIPTSNERSKEFRGRWFS